MTLTRRTRVAARQRYQCSECRKRDYGNYFISPTLCKKCAARRRQKRPNLPVEISENLVVTTNIEKKLRRKAEDEIPRSNVEKVADLASRLSYLSFWASGPLVAWVLFDSWSGTLWLFLIGWLLILPYALDLVIDRVVAKPRLRRREQVSALVLTLAQKRQRAIEERRAFYSSPEWKLIRDQVILEEGRSCNDCGRSIGDDSDITIDHKYPRSKHPELALSRGNLRVVCRQCNSRKGARDWAES